MVYFKNVIWVVIVCFYIVFFLVIVIKYYKYMYDFINLFNIKEGRRRMKFYLYVLVLVFLCDCGYGKLYIYL